MELWMATKMNSDKYIHNIPSLDLFFFHPRVRSRFWRFWDNKKVELTPGFPTCFQGMYVQNGGFVLNNIIANGSPWVIDFPSKWGQPQQMWWVSGHLVIGILGVLHLDTSTWLAWKPQVKHFQTGPAMFPFLYVGNRSTNGGMFAYPKCMVVVSGGVWRPNFGQHIEISRTILWSDRIIQWTLSSTMKMEVRGASGSLEKGEEGEHAILTQKSCMSQDKWRNFRNFPHTMGCDFFPNQQLIDLQNHHLRIAPQCSP